MRRRNRISAAEARAIAMEEQEKMEKLDEQGLCFHCQENPQNPALNANACLDCYESELPGGCMANGCVKSSVGSFQQMELCDVHLTDTIHDTYESYLEQKAELKEKRQEAHERAEEMDFDPENPDKPLREMTHEEKLVYDKHVEVQVEQRDLNFLKGHIKKAMSCLDEPFPAGYEVFG